MSFIKNKIIIIVIILLIGIISFKLFEDSFLKKIYKTDYSEYVEKYAIEYGVDENLVYTIIKNESKFDEQAISSSEAKGLMQLMDNTATEVAHNMTILEYDIYDAETNIMLGTKYLKELLERYDNNYIIAAAAYNAGIGNVENWIEKGIIKSDGSDVENIPFQETNIYVRKIIRDYEIYKELYDYSNDRDTT